MKTRPKLSGQLKWSPVQRLVIELAAASTAIFILRLLTISVQAELSTNTTASGPIGVQNYDSIDDFRRRQLEEADQETKKREAELSRPERITVIAPKYLRPSSDYHVLINLDNSQQPATFDVQLTGARDSNREQTEARSVLVQSGETQTVKFTIGDWPSAEYILSVQADAVDRSWNFTKESALTYHAKTYTTLIQTDKAIYKPGQLVQFRAIFLAPPNFVPLPLKDEINVTVTDAKRNMIKQWQSVSNYRGLLSLDLQLSEEPVLGDWTVKVEARGQEAKKSFQVAEYILPHFEVAIQLPRYATYNESDIVVTVKSSYTYGKPVRGHATLTVQPLVRFSHLDTRPLEQAQFSSKLDRNGAADFSVDLVKDLKLSYKDLFEREIEFFALVEEELTGRKYNKTGIMKIYDKPIKIERINKDDTFKPGMSFLNQLKVAYQDDTPVEDNGPEMELRYKSLGRAIESVKLRPVGGIVEHLLEVPKKVPSGSLTEHLAPPTSIDMVIAYRNELHYLSELEGTSSKSEQYMQLSLPQLRSGPRRRLKKSLAGNSVSVNDELKVRVQATEPMKQVTCQGISRGDIVFALSRDLSSQNLTEFEFELKFEQKMVPSVSILCFYIRPENKELIADSINIQVQGLTRNLVKLSSSREEAKPGQEVEVGVFTKPNALVGVLAIDQSVNLLRSGHDISQQDLVRELQLYGGQEDDSLQWSARNADSLFRREDLVIMTNNLVYEGAGYRYVMYAANSLLMKASSSKLQSVSLDTSLLDHELQPPDFHLAKREGEKPRIRSEFPETWIWQNATAGPDGSALFKAKAPDTITSWVMSAFSLSESAGFGLAAPRTALRVFRPFFIKLHLPYSIIRGETLSVQAIVFNYSKRPTSAKVVLENPNGDFEFVEAANSVEEEKRQLVDSQTRLVQVPPEDGASVSFLITPRKLGPIDIRMTAQSEFAADGLVQKLLVKPEGQTQFRNGAMLISLAGPESTQSRNFSIEVPANAVNGSQKVFVSAVGDILGPGLSNVDDLLRLPYGCGEQNMINLVPNIVIMRYLQNTRRLKESQRNRALRNIETGYQRELNYKRQDGSFSAFGPSDKEGSVWLTAYVLKTFQQAKDLITVDEKVIRRAANYIARHSRSDGSIEERGMVHQKSLQSQQAAGKQQSTYLTAYAMIALLQKWPLASVMQDGSEWPPSPVALDEVLERGLGYLERRLADQEDDSYNLAIIAYALQLAPRTSGRGAAADRAYEQLWSKAKEGDDMVWWTNSKSSSPEASSGKLTEGTDDPLEREFEVAFNKTASTSLPPLKPPLVTTKHSAHLFVPDSLSIEMTALALLTSVKRGDIERSLPIVRWLIAQQNSNGGFASTQDTVLAIEALATFAEATSGPAGAKGNSISLDIQYPRGYVSKSSIRRNDNVHEQLTISRSNSLLNQQLRLPDNLTWVQVDATGQGVAVVQVAWQYNLLVSAEQPAFYLNPIIDKSSTINYLQLSICTYYKAGESSNMALMEVELPSGYRADVESLPGLKSHADIKRIDTAQGDTKVFIYLDKVTRDEICLTIPAHRTSKVSNNKPVPVSIHDYYNRQQAARIFYEPHPASSCDICEADTCSSLCNDKPKQKLDRLVSLHEQRKRNLQSLGRQQKFDNLTLAEDNSNLRPPTNSSYQILPLAPVLMSLMAVARNLYSNLNHTITSDAVYSH